MPREATDPFALSAVDAVHDLRFRLREAFHEGMREEQVLGRAGAAPFLKESSDGAV